MIKKAFIVSLAMATWAFAVLGQQQTADGGYVICGTSDSFTNGYDDALVYKLTATGAKEWRKNYGGEGYDNGSVIRQTADGGYILAGSSDSYSTGSKDFIVYRLDAAGNKLWRRTYGGDSIEKLESVVQTNDGGFVIAGHTFTYSNGDYDLLVYKLDAAGNKQWRKNYGGSEGEGGGYIEQTADGGYILGGWSRSYSSGESDFLVYKLTASGAKEWRKNYGGTGNDVAKSIYQTADGGYVIAGTTNSYVHAFTLPPPAGDILVYKLSASGQKEWRKNFGGTANEHGFDARQTADGGYILCGDTLHYTNGSDDILVYRSDAAGNKLWRKNFGGVGWDNGYRIFQTADGGYLVFGDTQSYSQTGADADLLVYKVDADGSKAWRKNYGGSGYEYSGGNS